MSVLVTLLRVGLAGKLRRRLRHEKEILWNGESGNIRYKICHFPFQNTGKGLVLVLEKAYIDTIILGSLDGW